MDFFNIPNSSDIKKSEMELVEQKKHEYHLVSSMRKREGHILFSFNTATRAIKPAKIIKCKVYDYLRGRAAFNDKVAKEKNCIYLYALNKKNCIKHLKNMGYEL